MMKPQKQLFRPLTVITVLMLLATLSASLVADNAGITFFGWSDQHVGTDGSAQHLIPAIKIMNALPGFDYPEKIGGEVAKPAFVFGCGDISEWPSAAARDTYDLFIKQGLRYPSFDIVGNHDLGGKSPSKTVTDWLVDRYGALSYSFDMQGVHFVMVFSEYDENLNSPAQPISKNALDFIRKDLAKVAKNTPVVVATHLCYDAITNKDDLVDAFGKANILCVLGGHYHKAKVNEHKGVTFVQLPSPATGSPDEFTVIRITEKRIVAVPFDYNKKEWVTDKGKVLDAKIKGPKPLKALKKPKTLKIGDPAPEFMLPGTDNRYYSLKDFADSDNLAVLFTCNHCPTAQAYEDRIKQLVTDYKEKGVAVVAISPNDPLAVRLDELGYSDLGDTFTEMKIRARHKEYNFPYLYDGDNQQMSMKYGPIATPHMFIFDKDRKLRYSGRIDNSENREVKVRDTRNALDALIKGDKVAAEKTRVFGCSIKWADKREYAESSFEQWAKEVVTLNKIDDEGVKKLIKNDSERLRLVNVWATWCGPCRVEFPDLVTINRMYRNRDFEMVTISCDSPDIEDRVLSFLKKQQASTTNYHFDSEDKDKLAEALGGHWQGAIPFTMIIAPGGKILYQQEGIIDPLVARQVIVGHLGRFYK